MRNQDQKGEINAAEKRGTEKGIEQKTVAVVKKCLKKGMSIEDIADIAEISINEVKKIIAELNE